MRFEPLSADLVGGTWMSHFLSVHRGVQDHRVGSGLLMAMGRRGHEQLKALEVVLDFVWATCCWVGMHHAAQHLHRHVLSEEQMTCMELHAPSSGRAGAGPEVPALELGCWMDCRALDGCWGPFQALAGPAAVFELAYLVHLGCC